MSVFVDVLLPLPLHAAFTYSVPVGMQAEVKVGVRVCVPFGRSKVYAGLVRKVHGKQPEAYDLREIISVLDEESVVDENQFRFWEWMSSYYLCTEGEVMAAAEVYRAKIIDYSPRTLCVEVTGEPSKINAFIEVMKPLGIVEMCRTGAVALERNRCIVDK